MVPARRAIACRWPGSDHQHEGAQRRANGPPELHAAPTTKASAPSKSEVMTCARPRSRTWPPRGRWPARAAPLVHGEERGDAEPHTVLVRAHPPAHEGSVGGHYARGEQPGPRRGVAAREAWHNLAQALADSPVRTPLKPGSAASTSMRGSVVDEGPSPLGAHAQAYCGPRASSLPTSSRSVPVSSRLASLSMLYHVPRCNQSPTWGPERGQPPGGAGAGGAATSASRPSRTARPVGRSTPRRAPPSAARAARRPPVCHRPGRRTPSARRPARRGPAIPRASRAARAAGTAARRQSAWARALDAAPPSRRAGTATGGAATPTAIDCMSASRKAKPISRGVASGRPCGGWSWRPRGARAPPRPRRAATQPSNWKPMTHSPYCSEPRRLSRKGVRKSRPPWRATVGVTHSHSTEVAARSTHRARAFCHQRPRERVPVTGM